MVAYKQDMPPPGGYASICYTKVPPKIINVWWKVGAYVGITALGFYLLKKKKLSKAIFDIENRCAEVSLQPMLYAEKDRSMLKQLQKNRDWEEKLMENNPDWELGKFQHFPMYLTVDPKEYFPPSVHEYYAHTDPKYMNWAHKLFLYV